MTITLEFHCRLATRTKLFSDLPAGPHVAAGRREDPLATTPPGVLPLPNRHAVESALRLALCLHAEVAASSRWVRRHGGEPGLPRGYRITQSDVPLARGGFVAAGGRRYPVAAVRLAEDVDAPRAPHRAGDARVEVLLEPIAVDDADGPASACLHALRSLAAGAGVLRGGADAIACLVHLHADDRPGARCTIAAVDAPDLLARVVTLARGLRAFPRAPRLRLDVPRDRLVARDGSPPDLEFELDDPDMPPLRIDPAWLERLRAGLGRSPDEGM